MDALLRCQRASLESRWRALAGGPLPAAESAELVSRAEARLCLAAAHLAAVLQQYADCVGYLEESLRHALVAALGREVGAAPSLGEHLSSLSEHTFLIWQVGAADFERCDVFPFPNRARPSY